MLFTSSLLNLDILVSSLFQVTGILFPDGSLAQDFLCGKEERGC